MSEEIKTQDEQKNTVATVGMWFSISWLVAIVFMVLWVICFINGIGFWVFLFLIWSVLWLLTCWQLNLLVWFILWICGLFNKPRAKARVAVCIPLVVLVAIVSVVCYLWNSVKTPANEFVDWMKPQFEQFEDDENFDGDRFGDLLQIEINNITSDKTEEDRKNMFETCTGSNSLEKGSYLFFSILRQSMETALERYNNGEVPEINEVNDNIITIQVENDESEHDDQKDAVVEQPKTQNVETFSQSEKNEIDQILGILE